jgi:hypothetical protein
MARSIEHDGETTATIDSNSGNSDSIIWSPGAADSELTLSDASGGGRLFYMNGTAVAANIKIYWKDSLYAVQTGADSKLTINTR